MSTEKKKEDLKVTPLQENEAGQIEGGFTEIEPSATEEDGVNLALCLCNAVGCTPTTKAA